MVAVAVAAAVVLDGVVVHAVPVPSGHVFPKLLELRGAQAGYGTRTREETMRLKTEARRRDKASRPPASTASTFLIKIPTDKCVSFITAAILGINNKQVLTGLTGRKWSVSPPFLCSLSGSH